MRIFRARFHLAYLQFAVGSMAIITSTALVSSVV
jgi:hypothetical protein